MLQTQGSRKVGVEKARENLGIVSTTEMQIVVVVESSGRHDTGA